MVCSYANRGCAHVELGRAADHRHVGDPFDVAESSNDTRMRRLALRDG